MSEITFENGEVVTTPIDNGVKDITPVDDDIMTMEELETLCSEDEEKDKELDEYIAKKTEELDKKEEKEKSVMEAKERSKDMTSVRKINGETVNVVVNSTVQNPAICRCALEKLRDRSNSFCDECGQKCDGYVRAAAIDNDPLFIEKNLMCHLALKNNKRLDVYYLTKDSIQRMLNENLVMVIDGSYIMIEDTHEKTVEL